MNIRNLLCTMQITIIFSKQFTNHTQAKKNKRHLIHCTWIKFNTAKPGKLDILIVKYIHGNDIAPSKRLKI